MFYKFNCLQLPEDYVPQQFLCENLPNHDSLQLQPGALPSKLFKADLNGMKAFETEM
jgi:hypothetical protein